MGWGLTQDRKPLDRRQRKLTRNQLFAGAMLIYPKWYDPFHDRLCSFEEACATVTVAAAARAWRDDHAGWDALGMRLWKRKPLQKFFGRYTPVTFTDKAGTRPQMVWASKVTPDQQATGVACVEDGFIRSKGLGADLIAPMSLVLDDLGIYYDPTRPSRLEALIADAVNLPDGAVARAENLIASIIDNRLNKYNLDGAPIAEMPSGRRILVPGQVEDDTSIRLGASDVCTNAGLLKAVRAANPAAVIILNRTLM